MNDKVNLFIVGAPKSGTTSLFSYLCQHPNIIGGQKKEPHFFCSDFKGFRWFDSERKYEANYVFQDSVKYYVDASVMYFFSEKAPKEIYDYNPDAKIIILIREEQEFYLSFHNQNLYNRDEDITCPNQAWHLQSNRRVGENIPASCRELEFLQYKKLLDYKRHVCRFYEVFSEEQIMVIPFKPWVNNLKDYQSSIFEWLDISNDYKIEFVKENSKRMHKFKCLSYLTNQPNNKLLKINKFFKRILGLDRLNIASKIRKLNTTNAQYRDLELSIKQEISNISDSNKEYLEKRYFYIK